MVTIYSKPLCVQCDATHRLVKRLGIKATIIDISADTEALEYVKSLGHMAAPVVVAGDQHWSGYRPDRIKALVVVGA